MLQRSLSISHQILNKVDKKHRTQKDKKLVFKRMGRKGVKYDFAAPLILSKLKTNSKGWMCVQIVALYSDASSLFKC